MVSNSLVRTGPCVLDAGGHGVYLLLETGIPLPFWSPCVPRSGMRSGVDASPEGAGVTCARSCSLEPSEYA